MPSVVSVRPKGLNHSFAGHASKCFTKPRFRRANALELVIALAERFDLEFLVRLDAVPASEFGRQHDLTFAGYARSHEGKITSYLWPVKPMRVRGANAAPGLLLHCPAPKANLTAEGGFKAPTDFPWTPTAEEDLEVRLSKLMDGPKG